MNIEVCKPQQPCAIQNVMRSAFLKSSFPILPYCECSRGHSTKYSESFHIENKNTGMQLNFHWDNDNKVSISSHDSREKIEWDRKKAILVSTNEFNNEMIDIVCRRFLADA